jgi:multiple sugar transport system ATP-binding protein
MADVAYQDATKRFGDVTALAGFSLQIADGEFIVLVGPSGSGKTTALRLVAGLEAVSSGHVLIGGRVINRVAPKDRDIAMVFQDYALYPQMTVQQNLAFALKMRKSPRAEIEERVRQAAATLGIEELLHRKPRALSGGQRQRVALGRAMVREPQVFLMDEPLSNLDAKLRVQTRSEIKRLQEQIGTTTIYVTHDQVEAMTMGDRVVVMREGLLAQVGGPRELYEHPADMFVAGFIGSPSMSFVPVSVSNGNGGVTLSRGDLRLETSTASMPLPADVIMGVRPEHARVWRDGGRLIGPLSGRIEYVEMLGRETLVGVAVSGDTRVVVDADPDFGHRPGDIIPVGIEPGRIYLFDSKTEKALGRI